MSAEDKKKYKKGTDGKYTGDITETVTISGDDFEALSAEEKAKCKQKSLYYVRTEKISQEDYNKLSKEDQKKYTSNYVVKDEKKYIEAMTAFLMQMGFTEQDLAVAAMDSNGNILDEDGNPIKYKGDGTGFDGTVGTGAISAEWFNNLLMHMKKGVNCTATISLGTGMTGPTLTLNENNKPQISYQTDPTTGGARPTEVYRYNDQGFLVGVQRAAFEMDSTSNGNATGHWTFTYTSITYDSNGVRTDTEYTFYEWLDDPEAAINGGVSKATEQNNEVDATTKVLQTAVTHYSANNSALYKKDFTSNSTVYFADNRQSYVLNDQGTTIGLYRYSANGVITESFDANGLDGNGNKVGTVTIYDKWGRQQGTAVGGLDVFNSTGTTTIADLRAEYYKILTGSVTAANFRLGTNGYEAEEGSGTRFTQVYLYTDNIIGNTEGVMTNGFLDMKKVSSKLKNGNISSLVGNKMKDLAKFGYTANDLYNMLMFAHGNSVPLAVTQITHSTWTGDNIPEGADESEAQTTTTSVTVTGSSAGSSTETFAAGITFNNTILLGGAQAYQTKHNVITNKYSKKTETVGASSEPTYDKDPVVEGELFPQVTDEELAKYLKENGIDENDKEAVEAAKAAIMEQKVQDMAAKLGIDPNDEEAMENLRNGFYVDEEGKIYAIVNSSSINIMDGSGFQSANGEVVLVEIDKKTKEDIISNGSTKIMFMGDVRESVGGFLTMVMNESYGGGYVQGKEEVQKAKNEIMLVSVGTAISNGADLTKIQDQLDAYNKENGTNYTISDAQSAYEKAKESSDNSWIVNNTNANMSLFNNQATDYRTAWNLLLGKNSNVPIVDNQGRIQALF